MTGCYLIHFHEPYKQARHYLGWAKNISQRLAIHRKSSNRSVPLLRAVNAAGIKWELAATWEGDRHLERALRDQHNNPRLCPLCEYWRGQYESGRDMGPDIPF